MSAIRLRSPLLSGEFVIRHNGRGVVGMPLSFDRGHDAERDHGDERGLLRELIAISKSGKTR